MRLRGPSRASWATGTRGSYRTPADSSQIPAVSLSTGVVTTIQEAGFFGRYSPTGHLLFVRGDVLFGVPFGLEKMATTGVEVPLIPGVATSPGDGFAHYARSDNGTLLYMTEEEAQSLRQQRPLDRSRQPASRNASGDGEHDRLPSSARPRRSGLPLAGLEELHHRTRLAAAKRATQLTAILADSLPGQ